MKKANLVYRFAIGFLALITASITALSESRVDHIIPEKKWMNVPLGDSELTVRITHTWDEVHVWLHGDHARRPHKFKKVKGLHDLNTNLTLIYTRRPYRLYFVDTIAGIEKVKIAIIKEA